MLTIIGEIVHFEVLRKNSADIPNKAIVIPSAGLGLERIVAIKKIIKSLK